MTQTSTASTWAKGATMRADLTPTPPVGPSLTALLRHCYRGAYALTVVEARREDGELEQRRQWAPIIDIEPAEGPWMLTVRPLSGGVSVRLSSAEVLAFGYCHPAARVIVTSWASEEPAAIRRAS